MRVTRSSVTYCDRIPQDTRTPIKVIMIQSTLQRTLTSERRGLDPKLAAVLEGIAAAVQSISVFLRDADLQAVGTQNAYGDQQLQADVATDDIIYRHLQQSGAVCCVSSEEAPEERYLEGGPYAVAYDPLDGSSVLAANFAVGSIFGVWRSSSFSGQTGGNMEAAAYSIYGPRTVFVIARPTEGGGRIVQEFTLVGPEWVLSRDGVVIGERPFMAPANLRCSAANAPYAALLRRWSDAGLTLRYSGAMVPDVHHLLTKGGGVFVSPASAAAPAKLRLRFEVAPLAFVVEAAGGMSHNGNGAALAPGVHDASARSVVALGSPTLVAECIEALQHSSVIDAEGNAGQAGLN